METIDNARLTYYRSAQFATAKNAMLLCTKSLLNIFHRNISRFRSKTLKKREKIAKKSRPMKGG